MIRRRVLVGVFFIGLGAAFYFWPHLQPSPDRNDERSAATPPPRAPRSDMESASPSSGTTPASRGAGVRGLAMAGAATAAAETDFPIATPLNAPGSTIARDLDIVSQLFETWQSNFPREGNPVGENAEITAALMGENGLGLALIPGGHRAVNERGELCDRWGTPFRFHQLSGTRMEIRSAGPDRKFATEDDAVRTPQ